MEKSDFLWNDGWKKEDSLKLNENRAFQFGDGFFESMRFFKNGTSPFWSFHWDRLKRSIHALDFLWPLEWDEKSFLSLIQSRFPENLKEDLRVKIIFFRVGTGRYTPEDTRLAFYLSIEEIKTPWIQRISKIERSETVTLEKHPFSWIKTTSALPYVMANAERAKREMDDLLLCNEAGFVVEACYSSISWEADGKLYFPSRELGGFDSCHRRYLEKKWANEGFSFSEVKWTAEEILSKAQWICFGGGTGIRIWLAPETDFPEVYFSKYPEW